MYVLKNKNNDLRFSCGDHNLLLDLWFRRYDDDLLLNLLFSHGLRFCRAKGVSFCCCLFCQCCAFLGAACHEYIIGMVLGILSGFKFNRTVFVFSCLTRCFYSPICFLHLIANIMTWNVATFCIYLVISTSEYHTHGEHGSYEHEYPLCCYCLHSYTSLSF